MTVTCETLREWIGSLQPAAEWPPGAAAHLSACAACRERLDRERETRDVLRALPVPPADEQVRARVRQILRGEASRPPAGRLARMGPLQAAAAVLCILLTGGVLLGVFLSDRGQSTAEAAILDSVLSQHAAAVREAAQRRPEPGSCPECADPEALAAKISPELLFKPALESMEKAGFRPVLGNCCAVKAPGDGRAGQILYRRGRCFISCFMMKDIGAEFSEASRTRIAGVDCHVFERGGCTLVVSRLNGEVCVLCGRLSRAEMTACVARQWGPVEAGSVPPGLPAATLTVDGLRCRWCGGNVRILLEGTPGLHGVAVDAEAHTVQFAYDPAKTDLKTVRTLLEDSGYPARPAEAESPHAPGPEKR